MDYAAMQIEDQFFFVGEMTNLDAASDHFEIDEAERFDELFGQMDEATA